MTDKRNIYLKMKTLEEANKILIDSFPDFGRLLAENIDVADAVNRVLSEPVYAAMSSPNYHAAAMDGIAVAAKSTFGASETDPKNLLIGKDAHYINTGHVMPENTNAVIMIEHVNVLNDQQVEIVAPAFPWRIFRRMGEDIVATELVFARNHKLTPYCLGALIAAGIFHVNVYKKPCVFIQPTGSELVDHRKIDQEGLPPGQVLDSNSHMLGKLVDACGGCYFKNTIVEDKFELIAKPIQDAAAGDYDMIFISGGSSAGSKDFTREVISKLGEVLIHGVTMMPGKPVIVGRINEKPIFGIPGYPVSAIIAFEQLVRPLINRMLHQPDIPDHEIQVMPTKKSLQNSVLKNF